MEEAGRTIVGGEVPEQVGRTSVALWKQVVAEPIGRELLGALPSGGGRPGCAGGRHRRREKWKVS